jgi:hypothetical protein
MPTKKELQAALNKLRNFILVEKRISNSPIYKEKIRYGILDIPPEMDDEFILNLFGEKTRKQYKKERPFIFIQRILTELDKEHKKQIRKRNGRKTLC